MDRYPSLYNITRKKNESVAKVLGTIPLNVSFRCALTGNKLAQWFDLVARVANCSLNEQDDVFVWNLNKSNRFTIRSMYIDQMRTEGTPSRCVSWKLKIPLKIKVFLWYLKKGSF